MASAIQQKLIDRVIIALVMVLFRHADSIGAFSFMHVLHCVYTSEMSSVIYPLDICYLVP